MSWSTALLVVAKALKAVKINKHVQLEQKERLFPAPITEKSICSN